MTCELIEQCDDFAYKSGVGVAFYKESGEIILRHAVEFKSLSQYYHAANLAYDHIIKYINVKKERPNLRYWIVSSWRTLTWRLRNAIKELTILYRR